MFCESINSMIKQLVLFDTFSVVRVNTSRKIHVVLEFCPNAMKTALRQVTDRLQLRKLQQCQQKFYSLPLTRKFVQNTKIFANILIVSKN